MKRKATSKLKKWYEAPHRRPLILRGARQVGKTWLMKNFASTLGLDSVYVNFESERELSSLFEQDFDIDRILRHLSLQKGVKIDKDTLLIFDEVQEVAHGITSLKYFAEQRPEIPVLVAGSMLGVAMHQGDSFPVGKVEFLDVYPLDFEEFLWATGNDLIADSLNKKDWALISSIRYKMEGLLKEYYYVGGMPKVINEYIAHRDYQAVREEQLYLIASYDNDFSKHAPINMVPRIRHVWNSIVAQLSKENKKFIYGVVKDGARAREYELALEWLYDAGLFYKVPRVKSGELPLNAFEDPNIFKVFMLDVGLLGALCDLDAKTLIKGNELFSTFKGALTEQYVMQQLRSLYGQKVYYWSADNSSGEIDFLIQHNGEPIPIEVKAEENLQSKSLRLFSDKFHLHHAWRFSMADYREQDWMTNFPLYGIAQALQ
ncbi:MAG: ATP-binding protein [Bacteroidales bacterium]|nr:ATP-binding protein [Bacteroidales bacterium]